MSFARELLQFPDLFPERHSGERWGAGELALSLAGGPYLFRGLSQGQAAALGQRYGAGARDTVGGSESAVEIRVFRAPESDFRPLTARPWRQYPLDLDYRPDAVRIASRGFFGRLAWSPELTGALWTPVEEPLADLIGVFENFLRILVAYRLNEIGGVLLHSAGVVDGGRAFLFLGPSGAGKTTVARFGRDEGKEVLSDDMNLVRPTAAGVVTEHLPFAGDLGASAPSENSYPVAGLFRLEKAARHQVRPAPAPESLALLVSNAPFLNADPHRLEPLLQNLESLQSAVPLRVLAFRRDPGFWPLVTGDRA